MANVEKEMIKRPAKWPLDTLDACIRDFLWRRAPGGGMDVKADDIPSMCAEASTFDEAVWIACASKRRNGKMHTHQTKIPIRVRREFGYRIIALYPEIYAQRFPDNFDSWYDILWDIRPAGIGPLTAYDVATRVGAYLKLEPKQIYLHTGARLGWEAMWGWPFRWRARRVPPKDWPASLRQLMADQAEDFLCTYRETLGRIARDQHGPL